MTVTRERAFALVDTLSKELATNRPRFLLHTDYYLGKQPLKYASPQYRKYFGDRYKDFSDNWVQVVSDSPTERLDVTGFQFKGEQDADDDMWRVWMENGLDEDSQLAFTNAVNTSRSYVLVWGNPDDEETPEVSFLASDQAIVAYRPGSRRKRIAALNMFEDGEDEIAALYLPDEVWKFRRPKSYQSQSPMVDQLQKEARDWGLYEPDDGTPNPLPNPMGAVPIVEMPNKPLLGGDAISDVAGTIRMQDAINLLWAQLFVTADFSAFKQRLVLGAEMPKIPILDDDGQKIGERPLDLEKFAVDRMMWIEPNEDGTVPSVDEWSANDLAIFTNVIDQAVGHIAAQTRTPQHYLIGKMANLSGDALIAAESGLVQKTAQKTTWFGAALREMFRLICLAQGNESKAKAVSSGRVLWADIPTASPAAKSALIQSLKTAGFSFHFIASKYGLTPDEIAEEMERREEELQMDPMMQMMGGGAAGGDGGNPASAGTQPSNNGGGNPAVE